MGSSRNSRMILAVVLAFMWSIPSICAGTSPIRVEGTTDGIPTPAMLTADRLGNPSLADAGLGAFSQQPNLTMVERGYDYMLFSEDNGEGGTFVTAPKWIYDSKEGIHKPYSCRGSLATNYTVATAGMGAIILKNSILYYDPDFTEFLAEETFALQYCDSAGTWADVPLTLDSTATPSLGENHISFVKLFTAGYPLSGSCNLRMELKVNCHALKHTITLENTGARPYQFRILQKWTSAKYGDFMLPELGEEVHRVDSRGVHIDNVGPVSFLDGDRLVIVEDPTDDSNPVLHRTTSVEKVWVEDEPIETKNGTLIPTGHYENVTKEFLEPSPFLEFFTTTSMDIRYVGPGNYDVTFTYENPHNFTIGVGETLTLDPMTSTFPPYDTNQNGWIYRRETGYVAFNKGWYGSSYFPFGYYDPEPGETGYEYFYRSYEQFNVQGIPDGVTVNSVVLVTYMQETSMDDDINDERFGLLRGVLNDWGVFSSADYSQPIDLSWSRVINHGEVEKTASGEYRRWASWWDWEGGGFCQFVQSKAGSDYVRLRYSHVEDEHASHPSDYEYDRFKKETYRHRNGGPDPDHPNVLVVSFLSSTWDYTYDGNAKYSSNHPYWLVFPREVFGWGTDNVYDGEIDSVSGRFDVTEWGTNPGGSVYWGPHLVVAWPKEVPLGDTFEVEGDLWFDNGGSGTGGSLLALWDTNHKLMAILQVYDLWAYTETYRVGGYLYDENGQSIRSVDIVPQSANVHVNYDGVPWHIRGDGHSLFMKFHDVPETFIGMISEMGGDDRQVGFFSYKIWQRAHYGVCADPGGIDNIHFKTPHSVYVDVVFLYDQEALDFGGYEISFWIEHFMEGLNLFYQQYWENVYFYHKYGDSDWEIYDSNGPDGSWTDPGSFMHQWAIIEHDWPGQPPLDDEDAWATQGWPLPTGEGHGDYFDLLIMLTANRFFGLAGAAWRRGNGMMLQMSAMYILGWSQDALQGTYSAVAHEAGHCYGIKGDGIDGDTWGTRYDVMDYINGLFFPWSLRFDNGHQAFVLHHTGKHYA